MTARQLNGLFASTTTEDTTYDAGFYLRHPVDHSIQGSVAVVSQSGDIDLTVQADSGRACATAVAGLSVDEALELSLALEKAAQAAKTVRAGWPSWRTKEGR